MRLLSSHVYTARKRYTCNACEWISDDVNHHAWYCQFTCLELREIVKARRNNWCIIPGQVYIRQVEKYEGDFLTWRGIPAIHEICLKYDLYEYV